MPINWEKSLLIHPTSTFHSLTSALKTLTKSRGMNSSALYCCTCALPHSLSMYTHTPDPSISVSSWLMMVCCFFSHHSLTSHTCCSSSLPFQQPSISSMQHKCKSAMYFFSLSLFLCVSLSPWRPISLSLSLSLSLSQDPSLYFFLSHTHNFRGIMAMDRSVGPMSMWAKAWPQGRDR